MSDLFPTKTTFKFDGIFDLHWSTDWIDFTFVKSNKIIIPCTSSNIFSKFELYSACGISQKNALIGIWNSFLFDFVEIGYEFISIPKSF